MADQIDGSEVLAVNSVAYMLATLNWRFVFAYQLKHVNELLKDRCVSRYVRVKCVTVSTFGLTS